jgi:hypothetical protein
MSTTKTAAAAPKSSERREQRESRAMSPDRYWAIAGMIEDTLDETADATLRQLHRNAFRAWRKVGATRRYLHPLDSITVLAEITATQLQREIAAEQARLLSPAEIAWLNS